MAIVPAAQQAPHGDTDQSFPLTDGTGSVIGIGSFHKTLPHNEYGEVDAQAFKALKDTRTSNDFSAVPPPHPALRRWSTRAAAWPRTG